MSAALILLIVLKYKLDGQTFLRRRDEKRIFFLRSKCGAKRKNGDQGESDVEGTKPMSLIIR